MERAAICVEKQIIVYKNHSERKNQYKWVYGTNAEASVQARSVSHGQIYASYKTALEIFLLISCMYLHSQNKTHFSEEASAGLISLITILRDFKAYTRLSLNAFVKYFRFYFMFHSDQHVCG